MLGTTLGDLYMLSLSILGGLGQQELADVSHTSVAAHPKVHALFNVSGVTRLVGIGGVTCSTSRDAVPSMRLSL